jgi:hypothetical protein
VQPLAGESVAGVLPEWYSRKGFPSGLWRKFDCEIIRCSVIACGLQQSLQYRLTSEWSYLSMFAESSVQIHKRVILLVDVSQLIHTHKRVVLLVDVAASSVQTH